MSISAKPTKLTMVPTETSPLPCKALPSAKIATTVIAKDVAGTFRHFVM